MEERIGRIETSIFLAFCRNPAPFAFLTNESKAKENEPIRDKNRIYIAVEDKRR